MRLPKLLRPFEPLLTPMRPNERFRPGFWTYLFGVIVAAGAVVTVLRFWKGLGAVTNLSDKFPWGLWVGFDVLCGVALAAGGFTITAAVYVFNLKRFKPIVRPTVLTAFLGYTLVAVGLMYDLGKPWNIWHPMVMWNPRSPMFEVGWCVMLYLTVLSLEFSGIVFEKLGWKKAMRRAARGHRSPGDRGRHHLDPAPVLARLLLPDHPGQAPPALVHAPAALDVLLLRDRGRPRDDDRRVAPLLPGLRKGPRDAAPAVAGQGGRGRPRLLRHGAPRGHGAPGSPRRGPRRHPRGPVLPARDGDRGYPPHRAPLAAGRPPQHGAALPGLPPRGGRPRGEPPEREPHRLRGGPGRSLRPERRRGDHHADAGGDRDGRLRPRRALPPHHGEGRGAGARGLDRARPPPVPWPPFP